MIQKGTWDYNGHKYYHIDIYPENGPNWPPKSAKNGEFTRKNMGLTCRHLCGRDYNRPHFSCISGKLIDHIFHVYPGNAGLEEFGMVNYHQLLK